LRVLFFAQFSWGPEILSLVGFSFCGDTLVRVASGFMRADAVCGAAEKNSTKLKILGFSSFFL